jgi:cell wall-associated NlpC family hydrolase
VATPHPVLRPALTESHPHRPCLGARTARRLRAGVLVGAAAALTLGLLPGTAAAVPGEEVRTPEQAAQRVAEASHRLEVVTEQVNAAREELKRQQAAADAADEAAAAAQDQLDALDGQIREIARTAYTSDGLSQLDVLLTSDSVDDFVSQLGTLDAIAGHTNDVLAEVAVAAERAQHAQEAADAAAEEAQATLDEITAKQADLEQQIADYRRRYDALTREQQNLVNQAHAGTAVAVPAVAAAAGPAAQAAVSTALAQVGDPYVWGAGGPDAFDCSGLTQYAYAAAGISLPHSSRMQSQMGTPVSRDQLQPGDLVFFYSPVSHVGMYIGNGQMVRAATSGQPVQVVSLDSMGSYNSARRVA